MAQSSGFFNALQVNGTYDRKYNAEDYSDNLGAIISTGVLRSGNNDLYVQAAGGMALSIGIGRAWIEGKWYKNDTAFTDFSVPTAPTGDRGRVDRVALRLDMSETGRIINLVYKTGSPAIDPTAPELERSGDVYEIALADIAVNPNVTTITQSDIYDRRSHTDVCGWVTSPIGYTDYFVNFDAEFDTWFEDKKNTLASVTMIKQYTWHTTTADMTSSVTFNIPQYDPTGVDILQVYADGILQIEGTDYTASGSVITFTLAKASGVNIDVFVYKSIDGTGLGSVSDEVTELQNDVSALQTTVNNISKYYYVCNGSTDNVQLSDIAQTFLSSDTDYDNMTVYVCGQFGATSPYGGSGQSTSRYRWMNLGGAATTKKRITFDFSNCSKITLNCQSGYYYIGFYGAGVNIKNANVEANCNYANSGFVMFSATTTAVYAENCRFIINGYIDCYISGTGTFDNCKGTVINYAAESRAFDVNGSGLLRINGGEYLSYTGLSSASAIVIYTGISATYATAVVITNGMSCPTAARSGLYQTHAINCTLGTGAFNDTITSLTVSATSAFNVRGTYKQSKPDR